jgi:hypothetical protein
LSAALSSLHICTRRTAVDENNPRIVPIINPPAVRKPINALTN